MKTFVILLTLLAFQGQAMGMYEDQVKNWNEMKMTMIELESKQIMIKPDKDVFSWKWFLDLEKFSH